MKFDLSRPFLAIQQRSAPGRGDKDEAELVVNPLSVAIENVVLQTSGLECGAVGIAPDRKTDRIEPGEHAELGFSTYEEFLEMVCDWTLEYDAAGEHFRIEFISYKGMRNCFGVTHIPYVGGSGEIIPILDGNSSESWEPRAAYADEFAKLPSDERIAAISAGVADKY